MKKLLRSAISLGGVLCVLAGCATPRPVMAPTYAGPVTVTASGAYTTPAGSSATTSQIPAEESSPVKVYDAAMISAIQEKWSESLDRLYKQDAKQGKVTVQFQLHASGKVSGVKVLANNAGDNFGDLCRQIIKESAPFGKWPPAMAEQIGQHSREITFTFTYK